MPENVEMVSEDVKPSHERAALVARLRNKHRMKFRQIGSQLHISPQRAHQLYNWHSSLKEDAGQIVDFLIDD